MWRKLNENRALNFRERRAPLGRFGLGLWGLFVLTLAGCGAGAGGIGSGIVDVLGRFNPGVPSAPSGAAGPVLPPNTLFARGDSAGGSVAPASSASFRAMPVSVGADTGGAQVSVSAGFRFQGGINAGL